jgi:hypothetical protein
VNALRYPPRRGRPNCSACADHGTIKRGQNPALPCFACEAGKIEAALRARFPDEAKGRRA